jgi:hypothetical protein
MRHIAIFWASALLFASAPAVAGSDAAPVGAAQVRNLADDAARAWADDAELLYVENDADVDLQGSAQRWGYLYWSRERNASRVYSLRDGKIELAENPGVDLPSLPLERGWIDSPEAIQKAEDAGGRDYREKHAGRIESVVLVRGIFHEEHPERETWTVIYASDDSPSLWVVIDAESGDFVRKWEG